MNILIIYRHFWPDSPPYASMLRSIASKLVSDGHSVTVVCEQPSYKASDLDNSQPNCESIDGIDVRRVAHFPMMKRFALLRQFAKIAFPFRAWWHCKRHLLCKDKYDLVWTATIPPVVSGVVGRTLAKRYSAKFLYHCQDLYPEIAVHMGMIRKNGLLHRALNALERRTRVDADVLISLSADMATTSAQLAPPSGNHLVVNNFLLEDFAEENQQPNSRNTPSAFTDTDTDTVKVIFAGNIGLFQGLEKVVRAMNNLGERGNQIELLFLGEGKALPSIKALSVDAPNIRFMPHMPYADAKNLISQADYGLVSLEPEIYRFAYPSKTLTYLGLSVPLAVIVEPESQLVNEITQHDIGYHANGTDINEIESMFTSMIENRHSKGLHKANASSYYAEHCSRESVLKRWSDVIQQTNSKSPELQSQASTRSYP